MLIGIIGAMDIEVCAIKEKLENLRVFEISNIKFYIGKIYGKDVVVAKSGIGKVNAAMCTEAMILKFNPDVIVNTGIAGAIKEGINICDIVVAESVVQHDFDTTAIGDEEGFIYGPDMVYIPTSENVREAILKGAREISGINVHTGVIATGDLFFRSIEHTRHVRDHFGALVMEMEGGSIGQVCYLNGVGFCVVRAVSDHNSGDEYNVYKEKASGISVLATLNFIKHM